MSNKIKIGIKCEEKVQYDQIIEVTEEELSILKTADIFTQRGEPAYDILENKIDYKNISGTSGEFEYLEIEEDVK